jgi:hypothetical protein
MFVGEFRGKRRGTRRRTCVEIFTEVPGDEKTSPRGTKVDGHIIERIVKYTIYLFFLMVTRHKVDRSRLGFSMNLFVLDFVALSHNLCSYCPFRVPRSTQLVSFV